MYYKGKVVVYKNKMMEGRGSPVLELNSNTLAMGANSGSGRIGFLNRNGIMEQ